MHQILSIFWQLLRLSIKKEYGLALLLFGLLSLINPVAGQSKIWEKTFQGDKEDNLEAMVASPDGGSLLGGYSASGMNGDKTEGSRGGYDYWVVKTDKNGNKIWDKTFGGNKEDRLMAMVLIPDGGYLLGGYSYSGLSGDKTEGNKASSNSEFATTDYWIIKIDANGNKLWDKTYGGSKDDVLTALVAAPDGGFLLTGFSESDKSGDKSEDLKGSESVEDLSPSDYWVLKIDANGQKQWDKSYGGNTGGDFLSAAVASPEGGYLLGGYSDSEKGGDKSEAKIGNADFWVVKIGATGQKEWDRTFGTTRSDALITLLANPDGSFILGGTSLSQVAWVIKVDASGNQVWNQTYDFTGDIQGLNVIIAAPEGGYLLGGWVYGFGFWFSKVDENGQRIWNQSFTEGDEIKAMLITEDGNYLLGGKTYTNSGTDYYVIKAKSKSPSAGSWNMRFGGSGADNFTSAIKTKDGGYLSGGYTSSSNSDDKSQNSRGKYDYWIIKSNQYGLKLWDKRFGGSEADYLNRVIQTQDGGYLLAGSSLSGKSGDKTEASKGNRDYWLVKTDAQGNKEWDKTFGGSGYDELKKVVQLTTGEYVLGGYSNSPVSGDKTQNNQGGTDYWLVKISNNGTKLWDQRYGGDKDEMLGSFTETADGGFLLGGSSLSGKTGDKSQSSKGGNDYWVVKTDENGQIIWEKTVGGSGSDEVYSVANSGTGFFIAGTSNSGKTGNKSQGGQGGKDYWLVKLDTNGSKLWDKTYGGSKNDELRASSHSQDGGLILAGSSYSPVSGDKNQGSWGSSDYWIVQVDADGKQVYDKRFGGTGTEELRTVLHTADGGLLLGGRSNSEASGDRTQTSRGSTDYWLIKIAPENSRVLTSRVANEPGLTVDQNTRAQVLAYPNPFTEKVTIRFCLPETHMATIRVLDGQGKTVATLYQAAAQGKQPYEVEWQAGEQKEGLYFLQLQTPAGQSTHKLLLSR